MNKVLIIKNSMIFTFMLSVTALGMQNSGSVRSDLRRALSRDQHQELASILRNGQISALDFNEKTKPQGQVVNDFFNYHIKSGNPHSKLLLAYKKNVIEGLWVSLEQQRDAIILENVSKKRKNSFPDNKSSVSKKRKIEPARPIKLDATMAQIEKGNFYILDSANVSKALDKKAEENNFSKNGRPQRMRYSTKDCQFVYNS